MTTSIQREELDFASDDLGVTEDFLARAYTKMSIGAGAGETASARIVRRWLGTISYDQVDLVFTMSYDAAPLGRICLCRVHEGRIEGNFIGEPTDVFVPGDVTLFSPPDLPYSGRVCNARFDLTMFETSLLDRVASTGRDGQAVRLTGHRPVSEAASRRLDRAISYVRDVVLADRVPTTPLVASTTASMLAAVVLSTFPTNIIDETAADRADTRPELLRRAISFIESNADTDIALTDVARSVHLTPRALQYMFRKHLDMSPMEYLRRVRMDHAHRELRAADPGSTSISIVAARWGFAHTGRFAAQYRRVYGRNPSNTLRT